MRCEFILRRHDDYEQRNDPTHHSTAGDARIDGCKPGSDTLAMGDIADKYWFSGIENRPSDPLTACGGHPISFNVHQVSVVFREERRVRIDGADCYLSADTWVKFAKLMDEIGHPIR